MVVVHCLSAALIAIDLVETAGYLLLPVPTTTTIDDEPLARRSSLAPREIQDGWILFVVGVETLVPALPASFANIDE